MKDFFKCTDGMMCFRNRTVPTLERNISIICNAEARGYGYLSTHNYGILLCSPTDPCMQPLLQASGTEIYMFAVSLCCVSSRAVILQCTSTSRMERYNGHQLCPLSANNQQQRRHGLLRCSR